MQPEAPTLPSDDVDVVMVTHATRDLTVAAIGRLLERDEGVALRVLVHDNASPDGTAEALATMYPSVLVEAGRDNLGFAGGVNRALDRTSAPWLLLLNSDAWPEPGAIARLVATARANPDAAIVAPRIERPDGTVEHSTNPFPSLAVAATCAVGGYRRWCPRYAEGRLLVGAWHHDEPRDVEWAVGAAWLVRREALDDVGPLDEGYFMYGEDIEWCWRATKRGWKVRFEPAARVIHVGGASADRFFGARKIGVVIGNTNRLVRHERGTPYAIAYRALNAVGVLRLWVVARVGRRGGEAAVWAAHLRAHLGMHRRADVPRRP